MPSTHRRMLRREWGASRLQASTLPGRPHNPRKADAKLPVNMVSAVVSARDVTPATRRSKTNGRDNGLDALLIVYRE